MDAVVDLPPAGMSPAHDRFLTGANFLTLIGLPLLAAFLITWSTRFCGLHRSDSLIPALISTQHLTLYFWDQGRLGSLFPAMTAWISDISANFETQVFLRNLSTTFFPLFPIVVLRPKAPLAWVFADCVLVLFVVDNTRVIDMFWNWGQPYGPSLAILAGAVAVLELPLVGSIRSALVHASAFILVLLAFWLNAGLVLITVPLFGLLYLYRRATTDLVMIAMTLVAFPIVTGLSGEHQEYLHGFTFAWSNLTAMMRTIGTQLQWPFIASAALVLAISAVALMVRSPIENRRLVIAALITTISLVITGLFTANVTWVIANGFGWRYFLVLTQMLLCVSSIVTIEAIWQALTRPGAFASLPVLRRLASRANEIGAVVLPGMAAISLLVATLPVDAACHFGDWRHLEDSKVIARVTIESGARFIVSDDYWAVWPAVFEAIVEGGGRQVFAVALRGEAAAAAYAPIIREEPQSAAVCIGLDTRTCLMRLAAQTHAEPVLDMTRPVVDATTPAGTAIHTVHFTWSDVPAKVPPAPAG